MRPDVLLINPPWLRASGNIWRQIGSCSPPFGLGLLAAVLEREGVGVSVLDCNALRVGIDQLAGRLPAAAPRFVGITATTAMIENALLCADVVRARYPEAKVVVGGVHPTVMPEDTLASPSVDYIVMGEGEDTVVELVRGTDPSVIKGLGYKRDGMAVINPPRETVQDLDALPVMAYHLLPMDRYYSALGSYKRHPNIGMIVSRGCPGRCTFCKGDVFGRSLRMRSPGSIMGEIDLLSSRYGIKEISFYDDTFTAFKKNVRELCGMLMERRERLSWSCFSRVNTVDEDLLGLMKAAGCHQVMYGVESADEQILKNINKKIDLATVDKAVSMTKKAGIDIRLAFMLGSPGETEETMRRTVDYALRLDPDYAVFNITTPYPGTEMFDWADNNGCLTTKRWSDYDLSKPVMELPTVSSKVVVEQYRAAYKRFYMRPRYVIRRLGKIRNFNDLALNLKGFMSMMTFEKG